MLGAEHALGLEALGKRLDRILLAPLGDLLLGPVDLGVGGGVAPVAIGEGLDQRRATILASDSQMLGDGLAHRQHVHAVGADAGNAEALGLLREVGDRGMALDRGPHAVEVVLEDEDDRQAPQGGEVHRLAEVAGVRGAVAEHADGDVVGSLVVGGERDAGGQRQVAADDAVATEEATLVVVDVHRAAAPARGAVDAAEELGHDVLGVGAARDRVTVGAVGADQVVARLHRRGRADDRRLLADREVKEAARFGPLILASGLFLEAADQRHRLEQLETDLGLGKRPLRTPGAVRARGLRRLLRLVSHPIRNIAHPRARGLSGILEPVVAPEDLVADDDRRDSANAPVAGLVGRRAQAVA